MWLEKTERYSKWSSQRHEDASLQARDYTLLFYQLVRTEQKKKGGVWGVGGTCKIIQSTVLSVYLSEETRYGARCSDGMF